MTMAAAIQSRMADRPTRSDARLIARVDIVTDLAEAEPVWRALENPRHLATPYQRFDLLAPWQRLVGEQEKATPFIVIARDTELRPLLLLPLCVKPSRGLTIAAFMGGKHTNFNMGLWDAQFAATVNSGDLAVLISGLQARGADMLALVQQPERWRGQPNPLALLPRQGSINGCPLLVMSPGAEPASRISNSFRRRLRSKEKKFHALPGYRYFRAATAADVSRLLDWFFRIKPQRMAEQKLPNVFDDPGVEAFIRTACLTPRIGGFAIDIHALECNEEIIAVYAGVADGRRFSMMFNTYTTSENARYSPGLILMRNIIDFYGEAGYRELDLGVGADDYKRLFCKSDEKSFDSFLPLTSRGRLGAIAMASVYHGKRLVKQNQTLHDVARLLRGAFG